MMNFLRILNFLILIKIGFIIADDNTTSSSDDLSNQPPGALLQVDFTGKVGYLLNEIPESMQKETINFIRLKISEEQWLQRAKMQIMHTMYRQVFRQNYYRDGRLQLTLPPEEVWKIELTSKPYLTKINHIHNYVSRDYKFSSVLVGRLDSLNASESSLWPIGGVYTETFLVPADPEHVFQRIGYACADESSFSLDTVNSENVWSYHDQECKVEPYMPIANRTYRANQDNCHWTAFPNRTCVQAMKEEIGIAQLNITWTHLEWHEDLADKYRVGEQVSEKADIFAIHRKLKDEINVGYKYFPTNSCTLHEGGTKEKPGCIGAPGWRQLFRFTSSSVNVGKTALHLGYALDKQYLDHGIFEFSNCHLHYHFAHYENYRFGKTPGSKTGFCLQTTWRYYNNEYVPFNTPYGSCDYQGISVGWGDDYYQGLDCQWIDVTDKDKGFYELAIITNPDDFLCEGELDLNLNGTYKWIKTIYNTSDDRPVYRQSCNFTKGYAENNYESILVDFKGRTQTLISEPCKRSSLSPKKDCGFKLKHDNLRCEPGTRKTIKIKNTGKHATVVRVCESSAKLGHSTFCEYVNSLANVINMPGEMKDIKFDCPSERDAEEPGGLYSILVSQLIPSYDNSYNNSNDKSELIQQ